MWDEVFHHNYTNKALFTNETEALFCNEEDKFSILGLINAKYQIKHKYYEFILQYPDAFIHWRQNKNPVEEEEYENQTSAEGFEFIDGYNNENFKGLCKSALESDKGKCFINGQPGKTTWFFAIGFYKAPEWEERGIPSYPSTCTNYVSLWIKRSSSFSICNYRMIDGINMLILINLTINLIA
jgi:hypothetical protein